MAADYSGIYILIKTLSTGTFTISVLNYASIKLWFFLKKRASHNCKIKKIFKANKITQLEDQVGDITSQGKNSFAWLVNSILTVSSSGMYVLRTK